MCAFKQLLQKGWAVFSASAVLLSTSTFAQLETPAESEASTRPTLVQLERQFIDPLNQSLQAVAAGRGDTIEESYTYVNLLESYDYLSDPDGKLWRKAMLTTIFILGPIASTAFALLKKRLRVIDRIVIVTMSSLVAVIPATPPVFTYDAKEYWDNVILIAPDCKNNTYSTCLASKMLRSHHHITELHYRLASGSTGSCRVTFEAGDFEIPTTPKGYELVPDDVLTPYFEAMELHYQIDSCTHRDIFPETEVNSGGGSVVATGSIQLAERP